jgi:cobalt-zinc-cadmium efflux system protein
MSKDIGPERIRQKLKSRKAIAIVLALTSGFFVVEVFGSLFSKSLALLADATHMFTDLSALSLSLIAIGLSLRAHTPKHNYGYHRIEVLTALVGGIMVTLLVMLIFWQAYRRIINPNEVEGVIVIILAIVGLAINLIGARILLPHKGKSLVVQGAFLNVIGDSLASLAAATSGIIILLTDWYIADPIISIVIGIIILFPAIKLIRHTVDILMESSPKDIDLQQIRDKILAMDNILEVHDLHAWTLTIGFVAMSGHIVAKPDMTKVKDYQDLLQQVREFLESEYNVTHITLQIEVAELDNEFFHNQDGHICKA